MRENIKKDVENNVQLAESDEKDKSYSTDERFLKLKTKITVQQEKLSENRLLSLISFALKNTTISLDSDFVKRIFVSFQLVMKNSDKCFLRRSGRKNRQNVT